MEITARVCTLGVATRRLFVYVEIEWLYNVAFPSLSIYKNPLNLNLLELYFLKAAKAGFKVKYRSNTKTSSGCQMHKRLKIKQHKGQNHGALTTCPEP